MAEINIYSQEFQNRFRVNLKGAFPQAWQTLRLLEVAGLKVVGYAAGPEITLDVGLPSAESQDFEPAFKLRTSNEMGRFGWQFAAIARMDQLPDDLLKFFR